MRTSPKGRIATRLRDLSIKTKLALIVLATTGAALAVLAGVLAVDEFLRYRENTISVLTSHARIISINAAAAVAFRDEDSAALTLSALRVAPDIRSARIYNMRGEPLGSFARDQFEPPTSSTPPAPGPPVITLTRITLDQPIRFDGERIGFVRVEADFGGYFASLKRFGMALMVATAFALAAALSLLIPLRRAMTGPIEALAALTARVRRDQDFSLRANHGGQDELGSLAEGFNAMLEMIEQRDNNLARERDLVHTILVTTDASIVVADAQGRIVEANEAFLRAVGRSRQQCIGKPIWEVAGVSDAAAFRKSLLAGTAFEAPMGADSSEPLDFAWRSSRTLGAGGVELTVVTGIDITEHKRVETTLRRAIDAAEAAGLAKSRFVANMSHEIRTPMNGILGMAYVLQSECDEKQRHSLDTIIASGEALLRILNDILDFSKIEAGRVEIVRASFPLHEDVEDVVQVFAAEARAKGIALRLVFDPSVPTHGVGDSLRVRQVLSNLVGNAIKFTPKGDVMVQVDSAPSATPGADGDFDLRISVKDSGVGVSAEAQAWIFDAFTQGDSTTQREHGGTGLGLSISRQLVDMMGGQLHMSSEPGSGSTFWFTVPCGAAPSQPSPPDRGLGVHVLLAGGEAAQRHYEARRMVAWGASVDVAASVPGALEHLERSATGKRYDAIILDDELAGGWQRLLLDMDRLGAAAMAPVALLSSALVPASGSAFMRRVAMEIPKPVKGSMLYNFLLSRSTTAAPRSERDNTVRFDASVLLVEDNPVNVLVASAMLRNAGCRVTVATGGREALAALESNGFDLVMMDCQMPGLDGYASTRMIREREAAHGGHQRIVAVTAHALAGDRDACLAAGMDDYLAKPFSPTQLRTMLLANLARRADDAPAGASPARQAGDGETVHCLEKFGEMVRMESEGNPGLMARLGRNFEAQAVTVAAALAALTPEGDTKALSGAMHTFRSTVGHLGGKRLAAICLEIERGCAEGDFAGVKESASRFAAEVASLRGALALAMPVAP